MLLPSCVDPQQETVASALGDFLGRINCTMLCLKCIPCLAYQLARQWVHITLMVESSEAVAYLRSVGLKEIALTASLWAGKFYTQDTGIVINTHCMFRYSPATRRSGGVMVHHAKCCALCGALTAGMTRTA